MARSLALLALAGAVALAHAARQQKDEPDFSTGRRLQGGYGHGQRGAGPVDRTWRRLTKKHMKFTDVNLRTGGVPPRVTYGAGGAKTYSWTSEGGVQYTWAEMTVSPTPSRTPSSTRTPSTTSTRTASPTPSPGVVAWLPDTIEYDGYTGVFSVAWTAPRLAGAKAGGELPPGADSWFSFAPPGVCILMGGEQDAALNVVDPATGKQRYGFVATCECRNDATGLPPAGFSVTLSMPGVKPGVLGVVAPPSSSPTPSGTGTATGSGTPSTTVSSSPTPSNSGTGSGTPSNSGTGSGTPSGTGTASNTGTPTPTGTATASPSPTPPPQHPVIVGSGYPHSFSAINGNSQGSVVFRLPVDLSSVTYVAGTPIILISQDRGRSVWSRWTISPAGCAPYAMFPYVAANQGGAVFGSTPVPAGALFAYWVNFQCTGIVTEVTVTLAYPGYAPVTVRVKSGNDELV